jgi:hypothetical protein
MDLDASFILDILPGILRMRWVEDEMGAKTGGRGFRVV